MGDYLGKSNGPLNPHGEFVLETRDMTKPIEAVTIHELDALLGVHKPIIFDNCALHVLFSEAIKKIDEVEKENESLENINTLINRDNDKLIAEKVKLNYEIYELKKKLEAVKKAIA
jgi:hypothetical protein